MRIRVQGCKVPRQVVGLGFGAMEDALKLH